MNSDLSNVKAGDWIWTIQHGWVQINRVDKEDEQPILTEVRGIWVWYTFDGRYHWRDKYPSAFINPPAGFNAEPKPVKAVKRSRWAYFSVHLKKPIITSEYLTETEFIKKQLHSGCDCIKLPWTEREEEE